VIHGNAGWHTLLACTAIGGRHATEAKILQTALAVERQTEKQKAAA